MKKQQRKERARAKAAFKGSDKPRDTTRNNAGRTPEEEEDFRALQSLTTAKWNRYMLIRYLDAGLFFIGLYWAVMLFMMGDNLLALVAPLVDFAAGLVVILEVNRVLTHDIEYLKVSHMTLAASIAVSAVVLAVTAIFGAGVFFPFFSSPAIGIGFAAFVIVLKALIIWRIVLVRDRRDKKRYGLYVMQQELSSNKKGR